FYSSRRRHTRSKRDWSSDVCSSDLALMLQPKILLFDEPTSALDPELTGEVLEVMKDLAKEDMTMLVVTHEMEFAKSVADHVIFMDAGEIVEVGSPTEVLENPQKERTKLFLTRYHDDQK